MTSSGGPRRNRATRWIWFATGWVAVAVGGVGIVVPGLPSTGFFVLAAACFARSSPRFERWVLELPGVGPMVRDYRAGLGMPRRAKWLACSMIVVFSGLSLVSLRGRPVIAGFVVALAAIGVAYITWRVPTREVELARRAAGGDPAPR